MLTAEAPLSTVERAAVAGFAASYPDSRAACIDALLYVQGLRRYVSDAMLAELAGILKMSVAELDSVATFYNLIFRKPVGETVILLCDSITCWMLGRQNIADDIEEKLGIRQGETTKDGKFTLLPIVCLGHCDHAPAMLLSGALHGDLDNAKVSALLHLPDKINA